MGKVEVIDFLVYRWRYTLGYIAVSVAFVALLIMAGLFVTQGISADERASVVASDVLSLKNFQPEMIVNMPYHLLQKASFYLFGVSELSIKLPSLLLAFLSGVGILLLLRAWFKQNVTVLTGLLGVTTGPFLVIAQSGTPEILYILWSTWLIIAASMISRGARYLFLWQVLFCIFIALSLYTPLSVYVLLALLTAATFHPHLRHTIRSMSKPMLAGAFVVGLVAISPIIYSLVKDPSVGLVLLGINQTSLDIMANLGQLAHQYLGFANPTYGIVMTPVYELTAVLLIVLGLSRLLTTKYMAKSYILVAWLVLLAAVSVVNPALVSITFVPFLLLMAFGVDFLIRYWYRLFPLNPYARAAGLIPLVILVTTLTLSGVDRFMYGYYYSPSVASAFSSDLSLLRRALKSEQYDKAVVYAAPDQLAFYRAVQHHNPEWKIIGLTSTRPTSSALLIVTRSADRSSLGAPYKIITSHAQHDADRFYLYKNTAQ